MWPISAPIPKRPRNNRLPMTIPPPTPVPDGQHDNIALITARAKAFLGPGSRVGVVLDDHGEVGQLAHRVTQRFLTPGEVGGETHDRPAIVAE